ncbi:hypothetical protein BDN71DRAFT_1435909 [Pleurotus eryngii]|uniref:Uncharacterized protein n=1 Tax=Pleurotus eryngii TaxID=5323 RepID=A0A9P5ZLE2_PLEER|nr:hypothetical protein BDN71DRAFT_1435909 [Pleurotus eryngii]
MADYLPTALMFKFGQPHNMVAELAYKWYDILPAKQEIEQPFKFRAYYNMKEKQMMPARYSADWLVRAMNIITSDWSVRMASEASDILPTVPPPGRVQLSCNTSRHVIVSDNGTRSGSPALRVLMQSESPLPTPASPMRKIKKGGKTKLQCPTTDGTNDEELQYPPVHSNTAGRITDRSKAHAINTPQHTHTLTSQPSATARKRVMEEERLAHDAEWYWAAEGSKWQSKKSNQALNL